MRRGPCPPGADCLEDSPLGFFRWVKNQSISIISIFIGSENLMLITWMATPRASHPAYWICTVTATEHILLELKGSTEIQYFTDEKTET